MTITTEMAPDAGRTAMPGADQNPTIKKETDMSESTTATSEAGWQDGPTIGDVVTAARKLGYAPSLAALESAHDQMEADK